jgi:hypothetical protein
MRGWRSLASMALREMQACLSEVPFKTAQTNAVLKRMENGWRIHGQWMENGWNMEN